MVAVDDEEVFHAPAPAAPAPAANRQAPSFDDEADDVAPVAVPKKVVSVKKVVKTVAGAKK